MDMSTHYGICDFCGKIFIRYSNNQRFCDDNCRYYYTASLRRQEQDKRNKSKEGKVSINDIMQLAKSEGLSYGQYVAKHRL